MMSSALTLSKIAMISWLELKRKQHFLLLLREPHSTGVALVLNCVSGPECY